MKTLLVFAGICSISGGVGGCTGWYDDDARLSHYSKEMTQSLHDVRAAMTLHHDQVLDATSASTIDELEQTHVDQTNRYMAGAESAFNDIERCTVNHLFGERRDDWQAVYEADDAMRATALSIHLEMLRHAQAMRATGDFTAMLDEERVHRAKMEDLMASMESQSANMTEQMESLDKSGASMTCPKRTHKH